MPDIRIPRLNSNDDTYVLVEWLAEDGGRLRRGEPVAVVETSKAAEELLAEADGYLLRIGVAGAEYPVGQLIGRQFDTPAERDAHRVAPDAAAVAGYTLTDAARELADRHGLSEQALAGLGRKVIRSADLAGLLPPARTGDRRQKAVAAVVSRSHREIPAAHTVMRVYVDAALAAGRLPELFVKALGLTFTAHPEFFAGSGDVGVTVDTGSGLFIPVVRDPANRTLAEIAGQLMDFRKKAYRQAFRAGDLAEPGGIALSLSHEPDVVLAVPIVFPQHRAMLALGGVLDELYLDASGSPASRRYVHIGLSFDHRVVNGRDAVLFLRYVKDLVEHPERLA